MSSQVSWALSKVTAANQNTWLRTSDVTLAPLPAYNANDDADETVDRLALPNEDDLNAVVTSTLSSSPLSSLKTDDDYYTEKKQPNPDVMGLKALRNKVFAEDKPTGSPEEQDLNSVFAKAAKEEAVLKKQLHEQAAAKTEKHATLHKRVAHKVAAPADVGTGKPMHTAKKVHALKVVTKTADIGYKKGDVKKAEVALENMTIKEQEEGKSIMKEEQELKVLRASKIALQKSAEEANKKAKTVKSKEHAALETEMAMIKKQENMRLAVLAKKLDALRGNDVQPAAVSSSNRKADVALQQPPTGTISLAQKNPVIKAMSNLVEDEKEDAVFLGKHQSQQDVALPSKTVFKNPQREEQLYRQIVEVNHLKKH